MNYYLAEDLEVIDFTGLEQQSPQAGKLASGQNAYASDTPNLMLLILLGVGLLLLVKK